jgi:hypothetical protein
LEDGKPVSAQNFKYKEGMKIKGKCYLYSISLTPEMYDPIKAFEPVKNGASISRTVYDPMTFEPRKHILLTWSPEITQDILGLDTEKEQRQVIHKLLDDVLDNPEEYKTKGTRHVLVRGLFEVVDKYDGSEVVTNHYDVDLTANKPDDVGYTVYYLEQNVVKPGEIKLEIKKRVIPPHLKEKFISEVGVDPAKITEKMIDEFLEKNDVPKPFDNNRLRDILSKNKDVEDRISKIEKHDSKVKKMIKESKYGK